MFASVLQAASTVGFPPLGGELSPASVYVSLLPVVEACVVVAVPGRVGEVRVPADEPEAVDLDPGVLAPS